MIQNRPRVFCGSLCDWLDEEVPIEWLADLLALIHATPNLDWLNLTKRPESFFSRVRLVVEYLAFGSCGDFTEDGKGMGNWAANWINGNPPANVWIGTTVENQDMADKRIPALLRIPAKVRFLSCEPLLGPVDLFKASPCRQSISQCHARGLFPNCNGMPGIPTRCLLEGIDWIICGGESGTNARPMEAYYAQELRDQCNDAGVPFLFKQWGEYIPKGQVWADGEQIYHGPLDFWQPGKKAAGRLLDGVLHDAFPGGVV